MHEGSPEGRPRKAITAESGMASVSTVSDVPDAGQSDELRPSALETHLATTLPAGLTFPDSLCRAWSFMESQAWRGEDAEGYPFLTPYPGDAQLGPVFSAGLSIRGWLNPEAPGAERVIPIAETDGSGGMAAIWIDSAGKSRFVALSSEGAEAVRLADTPVDFLRLVAVGYSEFTDWAFGAPPESFDDSSDEESGMPDSVVAHSRFRAWVESEFEVTVPDLWSVEDDAEFNAWIGPLIDEHGIGLD